MVVSLLLLAVTTLSPGFEGTFFSGTGGFERDERFIELLDIARRQFSPTEYEYQSTHSLYNGEWDGLKEGKQRCTCCTTATATTATAAAAAAAAAAAVFDFCL